MGWEVVLEVGLVEVILLTHHVVRVDRVGGMEEGTGVEVEVEEVVKGVMVVVMEEVEVREVLVAVMGVEEEKVGKVGGTESTRAKEEEVGWVD